MDNSERENVRQLFGREGDFNRDLATIFGNAYLDFPDDTGEIPEGLEKLAETDKGKLFNVTELYGRAIELTPEVTCPENQRLLLAHIKATMNEDLSSYLSWDEIRITTKHRFKCSSPLCQRLDQIACFDNLMTPEKMKEKFGKEVEEIIESLDGSGGDDAGGSGTDNIAGNTGPVSGHE